LLSDIRIDPAFEQNYPIIQSCIGGRLNFVKELLKEPKVDPGVEQNRPFRTCCMINLLSIVIELLKDQRVDPTDINEVAIQIAIDAGNMLLLKYLLKDKRMRVEHTANVIIKLCIESKDENGVTGEDVLIELFKHERKIVIDIENYKIACVIENENIIDILFKNDSDPVNCREKSIDLLNDLFKIAENNNRYKVMDSIVAQSNYTLGTLYRFIKRVKLLQK